MGSTPPDAGGPPVPLDWSGEDYDCRAEVLAIEPCPRIAEGLGHVVTATMHGRRSQVLRLDLGSETIGTTPGHPFWSVDRAAWVEAGKLRTGERLQALGGEILTVCGLELGPVETVFNLEVNGAHHFAVGGAGVLAHNHCGPKFPGNDPGKAPDGYEWRGQSGSKPGSKEGSWYNPETGEVLRADLDHADPIGPHWDYRDADGNWSRIFPDGRREAK